MKIKCLRKEVCKPTVDKHECWLNIFSRKYESNSCLVRKCKSKLLTKTHISFPSGIGCIPPTHGRGGDAGGEPAPGAPPSPMLSMLSTTMSFESLFTSLNFGPVVCFGVCFWLDCLLQLAWETPKQTSLGILTKKSPKQMLNPATNWNMKLHGHLKKSSLLGSLHHSVSLEIC